MNLQFRHWDRTSKRFKRTKKDFIEVIGEFGTITQEHNRLFITKPWKVVKEIDCEVPEEIKKDWDKAADDYNNFARAWEAFCKRAKKDFGVSDPFDIGIYELRLAEKL